MSECRAESRVGPEGKVVAELSCGAAVLLLIKSATSPTNHLCGWVRVLLPADKQSKEVVVVVNLLSGGGAAGRGGE